MNSKYIMKKSSRGVCIAELLSGMYPISLQRVRNMTFVIHENGSELLDVGTQSWHVRKKRTTTRRAQNGATRGLDMLAARSTSNCLSRVKLKPTDTPMRFQKNLETVPGLFCTQTLRRWWQWLVLNTSLRLSARHPVTKRGVTYSRRMRNWNYWNGRNLTFQTYFLSIQRWRGNAPGNLRRLFLMTAKKTSGKLQGSERMELKVA